MTTLTTIIGRSLLGIGMLSSELIARMAARLAQANERFASTAELLGIARGELFKFEPLLADHLRDSNLASWIAGMSSVARLFPPWLEREFRTGVRSSFPPEPPEPPKPLFSMFEDEPRLRLPIIDNAAERLIERNIITRDQFDAVGEELQQDAFTIAGDLSTGTINRMRGFLVEDLQEGTSLEGFREKVEEHLGTSPIAPGHLCFLPGTHITGNVLAATKLWYDGIAIEIKTRRGNVLRVTANHPILTDAGWRDAGLIENGDNVLCHLRGAEPLDILNQSPVASCPESQGRAINNQQAPPTVENIFQSLLVKSMASLDAVAPVRALDFYRELHSPIHNGYVRSVRAYRMLMHAIEAKSLKLANEIGFKLRSVCTPHLAACGFGSLFNTGFCRSSTAFNVGVSGRHASDARSLVHFTPLCPTQFGAGPNFDPSRHKALFKSPGGDVQLFGKLMESFPGEIAIDKVVDIKRLRWSGHVYDVQADVGYVISDGIISSNSTVYRTNIQGALRDGRQTLVVNPIVAATFPYQEYVPIHDGRVRHEHELLGSLGLNGTGIYRLDDEVWAHFTPPWDYNCRCGTRLLTIEAAARAGVKEAQEWLKTGRPPQFPEWRYAHIPFNGNPGFGSRGRVGVIV